MDRFREKGPNACFFKISNFSILVSRSRSNPSIRLPLNLQIHTCTQLQHTGNVHAYRFLSGKKWTEQERACDGGVAMREVTTHENKQKLN